MHVLEKLLDAHVNRVDIVEQNLSRPSGNLGLSIDIDKDVAYYVEGGVGYRMTFAGRRLVKTSDYNRNMPLQERLMSRALTITKVSLQGR